MARGQTVGQHPINLLDRMGIIGDQQLYQLLTEEELQFEYVIRFRGNIKVTAAGGVTRTAAARVSPKRASACVSPSDG